MGTMIDAPWDRYPVGTQYPLIEYAKAGSIRVKHLENVDVVVTADGATQIRCMHDPNDPDAPLPK
jgi:hypothetical protein